MMRKELVVILGLAALWTACSDKEDDAPNEMTTLRPGVEDSSQAFKGTLSDAQAAFWVAVRDADDAAREKAAAALEAAAADDPTDGYSAFLRGAHAYMPGEAMLRALVDGTEFPEPPMPGPDAARVLEQAVENLTDPLYLGFSAALLAGVQSDPAAQEATTQLAIANNLPATLFGKLSQEAAMGDAASAADTIAVVLEYCTGSPLDREQPDAAGYVARGNAAGLSHRECYSGYFAPHGTEGLMLIMGDLEWTLGNEEVAPDRVPSFPGASSDHKREPRKRS